MGVTIANWRYSMMALAFLGKTTAMIGRTSYEFLLMRYDSSNNIYKEKSS